VLDHQVKLAVQLRGSRLAVTMLTVAEPAVGFENDSTPDHWLGGFAVHGFTAVLPRSKCGRYDKQHPNHSRHDRSGPGHYFTSTVIFICGWMAHSTSTFPVLSNVTDLDWPFG
jgi:hypothetical protein